MVMPIMPVHKSALTGNFYCFRSDAGIQLKQGCRDSHYLIIFKILFIVSEVVQVIVKINASFN
uniref:Uncharacterized protein n=1 Tax=Anguilla anguilla TaxID=7936 RepID=A0A0E9WVT5_ANGAN